MGNPVGSTDFRQGDKVIAYGSEPDLLRFDKLRAQEDGYEEIAALVAQARTAHRPPAPHTQDESSTQDEPPPSHEAERAAS